MVSKRHIELSCNSLGKLHLLDLNSTNGTFKRISAEKEISDDHILNHLDIIKFGPFEFQIIKR
jgi:pSer/pThr/pTyr-binding forkhead associated (FHA) protein